MIPFNRLGFLFKRFGNAIYPQRVRDRLGEVVDSLGPKALALDLGGGTGILAALALRRRQDLRCVVLDPAMGMLRHGGPALGRAAGVAEEMPFKTGLFDAVFIGDALHHFDNGGKALSETVRVMKRGGILFIFDIDPDRVTGRLICVAERLLGEPAGFLSPETLKQLLGGYGFMVRIDRCGWRYSVTARAG